MEFKLQANKLRPFAKKITDLFYMYVFKAISCHKLGLACQYFVFTKVIQCTSLLIFCYDLHCAL